MKPASARPINHRRRRAPSALTAHDHARCLFGPRLSEHASRRLRVEGVEVRIRDQREPEVMPGLLGVAELVMDHPGVEEQPRVPCSELQGLRDGGEGLPGGTLLRSEEHTSELQSQSNLVCRLLLEKKKQNTIKP